MSDATPTPGPSTSTPNQSTHVGSERGRGRRGRGGGRGRGHRGGRGGQAAAGQARADGVQQALSADAPAFQPNQAPEDRRRGHGGPRGQPRRRRGKPNGRPPADGDAPARKDASVPSPDVGAGHRQNRRRERFGGQLTGAVESGASSSAGPRSADTSLLSLSARITLELSTSQYDCPICYSSLGPNSSIAPCSSCYAVFHLSCLREWASRSVESTSERTRLLRQNDPSVTGDDERGVWRCPGCQGRHFGVESVPSKYTCWCGKVETPSKKRPPPATKVPHSCAQPCGRIQAARNLANGQVLHTDRCHHPCSVECHPGACPPCSVVVRRRCHCGKLEKAGPCSQVFPASAPGPEDAAQLDAVQEAFLSCHRPCGKILSCGEHECQRTCHSGPCGDCDIKREKRCYCSKVVRPDEKCAEAVSGADVDSRARTAGAQQCLDGRGRWVGEFACSLAESCAWKYDCGIHACDRPTSILDPPCHPHDSASLGTCPLSPESVASCPCGKVALASLSSVPRRACTDPIPTCPSRCSRPLLDCSHPCPKPCHEGPCGPCSESVTTPCRCGHDKTVRPCAEVSRLRRDSGDEAVEVRCERVCRALRRCGKHVCARRCCPLSFLEGVTTKKGSGINAAARMAEEEAEDPLGLHVCDRRCGKKLGCGLHECDLPDHRGKCPPCLRAGFEEVSCHCGATVLMPPIPCGTVMSCDQPCRRPPPPCGHPKAPHTCHEEGQCPPCPFLTTKACQCHKKNEVKNVRCSQEKVTCGTPCLKTLACGAHRCRKVCHPAGECESCDQVCAKALKHCGHGCPAKCHAPSSCPTEDPCPALIDAKCACGHITQRVRCSSCDSRPEGNRSRVLKCSDACAVAQRNAALAEALGIDEAKRLEAEKRTVEWEPTTVQFFAENIVFARNLEAQLEAFMKGDKPSLMLSSQPWARRRFTHDVAEAYGLGSESIDEEPYRSVRITRKVTASSPNPLLSEVYAAQHRKPSALTLGGLRQKAAAQSAPPMNAIYLESVLGHDEASLRSLLVPRLQNVPFDVRWIAEEDVILCPLFPPSAASAIDSEARLRGLRSSLRVAQAASPFCAAVELARVDDAGALERRESWTPVAPTAAAASSGGGAKAWKGQKGANLATPNAFGALANGGGQSKQPAKSAWGAAGSVVGGGFNRPPAAVIAPSNARASRPVSPRPASPVVAAEDPVEDWETRDE